jgi:hypothetical protein
LNEKEESLKPNWIGLVGVVALVLIAGCHANSKLEHAKTLLARGAIQVQLDARRAGVVVPAAQQSKAQLRLDVGYHMEPPINDLVVDEKGIGATLSFDHAPFATFVPWSAVFFVADLRGQNEKMWIEDVPAELRTAAAPHDAAP